MARWTTRLATIRPAAILANVYDLGGADEHPEGYEILYNYDEIHGTLEYSIATAVAKQLPDELVIIATTDSDGFQTYRVWEVRQPLDGASTKYDGLLGYTDARTREFRQAIDWLKDQSAINREALRRFADRIGLDALVRSAIRDANNAERL